MRKLVVDDIPSEGLELKEEERPRSFGLADDKFVSYTGGVSVSLMIEKIGDLVKVKGNAGLEAKFICVRCLKPFFQKITSPLDIVYGPELARAMKEEESLSEKESDTFCYGRDGIIDLGDAIREYIILSLPVKPLCVPGCLGLCPSCGKDLNQGPCSCQGQRLDPRFDKLKNFKERKI